MRCFRFSFALLPLCLLLSCARADRNPVGTDKVLHSDMVMAPVPLAPMVPLAPTLPGARPYAIIQAGEYPLWFQFTDNGPVLIETIEDACFSTALIPWPLAPHVRFMLSHNAPDGAEELFLALNRDGFIRFSLWNAGDGVNGIGLYRGPGGELWRHYTVGAFIIFKEQPVALLYRDDRFLDSSAPVPSPRLWTFDRYNPELKTPFMPSLDAFVPEDGWDIDAFRRGPDGYWYFRATRKNATQPEIRMFRTDDLQSEGERVSLGAFQNAALPEPLSAAPPLLREMLVDIFAASGCGTATVISPEFLVTRHFAEDRAKPVMHSFYSDRQDNTFFLAITPQGNAFYTETGAGVRRFSLPSLPENFIYTGIGVVGNTIIASWEEQESPSIGAAGFMIITRG